MPESIRFLLRLTFEVMLLIAFFLASTLVVKQDGTTLRSGCERTEPVIGKADAGSPTEIKFSMMAPEGRCYKVSVVSGGKTLEGYVNGDALGGTEEYEAGIRSAPVMGVSRAAAPEPARAPSSSGVAGNPLVRASALMDQKQPRAALDAVEQGLKAHGRDYNLLVAAGIAAEAADQPKLALEYLREAEGIREDHSVQQLIARLEREVSGDKSSEKLFGNRFILRYEEGVLQPDIAHAMVGMLEQEFTRIAAEVGCRTDERIVTVVQSRIAYRASASAAEWSGGQFDGHRIRIPIADGASISPQTQEAFSHELVHACLANTGQWPAWMHEGLAQKLSGRTTTDSMRRRVSAMLRAKQLPRLDNMSQSWSRMSGEHAMIAYQYALVAVETLYEMYAAYGIQNVLRAPERLSDVTAQIDKHLAR